jgi:glutathione synthase
MKYPPRLSDGQLEVLVSGIKDWQITHGSLLKLVETEDDHTVLSRPVGVTLFPTLFPKNLFKEALALQTVYNKLYASVAEDDEWLYSTLGDLIEVDLLSSSLWSIHEEVNKEGYVQDLTLGISRSDYMLHAPQSRRTDGVLDTKLKQVELNTVSCAGGVHSNMISDMHRRLHQTGAYESNPPNPDEVKLDSSTLPPNTTLKTITSGLEVAHKVYGPPKSGAKETCILFIVQPYNFNIADERPIEYALWEQAIPSYRVLWGHGVLSQTSLTPSRELLYHPPSHPTPMEVSVVYFRAGFGDGEYNEIGLKCRLYLERSRAIKCPSVLSHLTTFKKVQQALALPGALDRWLSPDEAAVVARTFAPIYPLDESESGIRARELALDPNTAKSHVLKPSREGGGHNIYGEDIVGFLDATPKELWPTYILMEKIIPPIVNNFLMSSRGMYEGPVISELGIFGVYLWRRKESLDEGKRAEMVKELGPCWSFKTKDASVNEMSVVKGYGCFDSPALVDKEVFSSCIEKL